jgi:hypothetical protein
MIARVANSERRNYPMVALVRDYDHSYSCDANSAATAVHYSQMCGTAANRGLQCHLPSARPAGISRTSNVAFRSDTSSQPRGKPHQLFLSHMQDASRRVHPIIVLEEIEAWCVRSENAVTFLLKVTIARRLCFMTRRFLWTLFHTTHTLHWPES